MVKMNTTANETACPGCCLIMPKGLRPRVKRQEKQQQGVGLQVRRNPTLEDARLDVDKIRKMNQLVLENGSDLPIAG